MSNNDSPITPPPQLRQLWAQQAQRMDPHDPVAWQEHIATQASRWGAYQELEACCEWVSQWCGRWPDGTRPEDKLRAARRPGTPSLKEQSLELIDLIQASTKAWNIRDLDVVRHALQQLPD